MCSFSHANRTKLDSGFLVRVFTLQKLCLENAEEGDQILEGLMSITERKTVPQVFIKSEFIGGCDGESL